MELDTKTIVIIAVIIVGLFAGGLSYIYFESNNRRVALDLMQQYISTDDVAAREVLASDIKKRLEKKNLALTSKASFESFDSMLKNAVECDRFTNQTTFNPRETNSHYNEVWRKCMNDPSIMQQKNTPQ